MPKPKRKIIMDTNSNSALFKLQSLALKNFRCYEELKLELEPCLTVLVADNGGGKTTILDAIRIGLWPYLSGFDLANKTPSFGNSLQIDDIRLTPSENNRETARQLPVEITLTGEVCSEALSWMRFRDSELAKSQTKSDAITRQLKKLAEQQQVAVRDLQKDAIDLPIFGYYGTGRLWDKKKLTSTKSSKTDKVDAQIRTFAYTDCLDPASSYRQFESWFTDAFLVIREEQIERFESGYSNIKASPEAENPVTVIQKAVNTLLSETGWHNPAYSQKKRALVLHHKEQGMMPIELLSDGIKNMLAMVGDIAYRCALLNSHLGAEAAQKSQGVVMIDEVDMHLHPRWQQTVISGLLEAFPNIQFIVTTHSPQVLSTVPDECIRILKNGKVHASPKGTKGAESSRVLKRVFDVDVRPQNDNNTQLLNTYLDAVYADKWIQSPEPMIEMREKLDAIYADEEPALTEADVYIDNRKWEFELEKDQ